MNLAKYNNFKAYNQAQSNERDDVLVSSKQSVPRGLTEEEASAQAESCFGLGSIRRAADCELTPLCHDLFPSHLLLAILPPSTPNVIAAQ